MKVVGEENDRHHRGYPDRILYNENKKVVFVFEIEGPQHKVHGYQREELRIFHMLGAHVYTVKEKEKGEFGLSTLSDYVQLQKKGRPVIAFIVLG